MITLKLPFTKTITIRPAGEAWVVTSLGADPQTLPDPLVDTPLAGLLQELREWTTGRRCEGMRKHLIRKVFATARKISGRLTPALLSDTERQILADELGSRSVQLAIRAH